MTKEELEVIMHKMTKEQIMERAKTLRPVADFTRCGGMRYWVESAHIATMSYTWDLKKIKPTPFLKEIARIKTYHQCGHPSLVKPSVDECVYQCPDNKAVAFQILVDTARYNIELDCHVCETIYYTGEMPKDIMDREIKW